MKPYPRQSKPQSNRGFVTTFILAALLVLFVILYPGKPNEPTQYELTILELGSDSMLVHSRHEELGLGEILLVYGTDMVVEDVNGQSIDFAELDREDRIRVEIAPRKKDPDYDRYLDPVAKRIVLLPDDSDEYI